MLMVSPLNAAPADPAPRRHARHARVRPRETFTLTICGVQDIHTHTQRNAEASAANNESPAT